MCILCGEMITNLHWSEEIRDEGQGVAMEVIVGEKQRERMRSRLQKVKIAQRILRFYGLGLKEWHGSKFILSDAKGQSVVVQHLGALWIEAGKMAKRDIDVLYSNFIEYLSHSKID